MDVGERWKTNITIFVQLKWTHNFYKQPNLHFTETDNLLHNHIQTCKHW